MVSVNASVTAGIASGNSTFWTTVAGVVWIAIMCWICYIGIEISAHLQVALVVVEVIILVTLGIVALAVPERSINWDWAFIGGLAYSVMLASAVAWWLWSIVLQRLPTTVASLSSLGVPIVSVLLAWMILHEQPSMLEVFGIALVLLGLVAVSGIGARQRA